MKKTNHSLVDMLHVDNDIHHYHINGEYVVMLMEKYQLVQQLLLMLSLNLMWKNMNQWIFLYNDVVQEFHHLQMIIEIDRLFERHALLH